MAFVIPIFTYKSWITLPLILPLAFHANYLYVTVEAVNANVRSAIIVRNTSVKPASIRWKACDAVRKRFVNDAMTTKKSTSLHAMIVKLPSVKSVISQRMSVANATRISVETAKISVIYVKILHALIAIS